MPAKQGWHRNSTSWKPGQSGNPAGRKPKAECLVSCIKEELAKIQSDGRTTEQHIAQALTNQAKTGDLKAVSLLLEFTAMKPAQAINLGGNADAPPVSIIEVRHSNAT